MSKRLPRISIITPSYNQAQFIGQTIKSVLSQNYPDLEYIVMDGGSTDGTLDIIKKYKSKLLWISQKDRGQSDAINKGFRKTTGKIIGFINSDDQLEEGCLETIGNFFYEYPQAYWVTGKCRIIEKDGIEIRKSITLYKNLFLKYIRNYTSLLILNYISQPSTFWRKTIFNEIGGLDEKLHYSMDYDYWLKIWRKYPLFYVDRYLAKYRVHSGSKGGSSPISQFDAEYKIVKKHTNLFLYHFLHKLHKDLAVFIYSNWNFKKIL